GMAIHLFFSSMTQGIILLNEDATSTVMFWLVGSLSSITWTQVLGILPWLILAFICTIIISKQLTIMELVEDLATSLGHNVKLIRMINVILVIVLASTSVSFASPIDYLCLIVRHIDKPSLQTSYRLVVPITIINS